MEDRVMTEQEIANMNRQVLKMHAEGKLSPGSTIFDVRNGMLVGTESAPMSVSDMGAFTGLVEYPFDESSTGEEIARDIKAVRARFTGAVITLATAMTDNDKIGKVMLDAYRAGGIASLSPEAPGRQMAVHGLRRWGGMDILKEYVVPCLSVPAVLGEQDLGSLVMAMADIENRTGLAGPAVAAAAEASTAIPPVLSMDPAGDHSDPSGTAAIAVRRRAFYGTGFLLAFPFSPGKFHDVYSSAKMTQEQRTYLESFVSAGGLTGLAFAPDVPSNLQQGCHDLGALGLALFKVDLGEVIRQPGSDFDAISRTVRAIALQMARLECQYRPVALKALASTAADPTDQLSKAELEGSQPVSRGFRAVCEAARLAGLLLGPSPLTNEEVEAYKPRRVPVAAAAKMSGNSTTREAIAWTPSGCRWNMDDLNALTIAAFAVGVHAIRAGTDPEVAHNGLLSDTLARIGEHSDSGDRYEAFQEEAVRVFSAKVAELGFMP